MLLSFSLSLLSGKLKVNISFTTCISQWFDKSIYILFDINNIVLNIRTYVGYGLELSRILPLIIFHIKRKYLCKTETDLKDAWLPSDLGYAIKIPNDMLILTITLCYSVIAPLIIPFGAIYFGLGWLVYRNQVNSNLFI